MIRPFALADVSLVYRLQEQSVPLAIEHILTHPRPPLWLALTAPWPWAGLGVATYVLRGSRGARGFVQLLKRSARPEADLLHMAPALSTDAGASPACDETWRELLAYCTRDAAIHGLQRIYASVPDGGAEMAALKELGFSLFARETIYRLPVIEAGDVQLTAGFRKQRPQDSWSMQRLYARCTPCLVQQAEGAITSEAGSPAMSWWEPDRWRGIVWAPAGEVRGVVQVHIGRSGHWLRVWGVNVLPAREIRLLIEQGLALLAPTGSRSRGRALPVYATVRDYEGGLSGALTGFGFAPMTDRARFVRHTVAVRPIPAVAPLPVLERTREVPVRSQAHPTK